MAFCACPDQAVDNIVEILRISGAFGIKGLLRAILFSDNIRAYKKVCTSDGQEFDLRVVRFVGGRNVIIGLSGVDDRTQALAMKGASVYVKRSDLGKTQEEEYYICDLIGKKVKIVGHDELSCRVLDVHNFGAGDLIEISHKGGTFMVPFRKENFPQGKLTSDSVEEILMTYESFSCYKN